MATNNKRNIFLAILALVIASLSCVTTPGESPAIVAVDDELQDLGRNACNGTAFLIITSEITSQGTNQFGTRGCEYTLKIKNNHAETAVWFYFYQHDQDGYAGTEKYRWMGNILVEPGEEGEWTGSIYIYTDPDADGPVMSIPEKMAGVFDMADCAEQKRNDTFFEQIAIPVDPVCPLE